MGFELLARPQFGAAPAPAYRSHEVHRRVFTPRQCARIVALGTQRSADAALLEGRGGEEVADDGIRRSQVAWIPPDDDTWWIYEKLARVAAAANRRYRFDLTGFTEDLQFTTYDDPGAFYGWHQDGLDGAVATRKLSLVAQLTPPEEYEGAELELFDVTEDLDPAELLDFYAATAQQGTVVAFPSFEYHRVRPLRRGCRRSLVVWVGGPPFR